MQPKNRRALVKRNQIFFSHNNRFLLLCYVKCQKSFKGLCSCENVSTPHDFSQMGPYFALKCPVAKKQTQIITPLLPCLTASMKCLVMICCVFMKCDTLHRGQTSPPWSHLSKEHFSRCFWVCSGPKREEVFSWQPFQLCSLLLTVPSGTLTLYLCEFDIVLGFHNFS